jgi:hypothetical protein
MAAFHDSCVSSTSSEERHTCERINSPTISRQLEAKLVRPELTPRLTIPFAQRPRIAEFDRVAVPMFTLPCGVHDAAQEDDVSNRF